MHVVAEINGMEKLYNRRRTQSSKDEFAQQFGGVSGKEFEKDIKEMKEKGMKYIPNANCKNRNPDGSCGCTS